MKIFVATKYDWERILSWKAVYSILSENTDFKHYHAFGSPILEYLGICIYNNLYLYLYNN